MISGPVLAIPHYAAREAGYPAGARFGPHRLAEFEFVWLLAGSAVWTYQGPGSDPPVTERLAPGTVLLARPGGTDTYSWDPWRRTVHGYLHFDLPEVAPDEVEEWPFVRSAPPGGLLDGLCGYLLRLSRQGDPDAEALTAQALSLLVTAFVRGDPPDVDRRLTDGPLAAAVEEVRRSWRTGPRPVSLAELAAAAGMSPGHLSRRFTAEFGHGLVGALERIRLGRAAVELQRTDRTLARIAAETGFGSPYHLSRRFAAVYGVPPGRFRRTRAEQDALAPIATAGLMPLWAALRD
jgi:AraC family transcriptional regulator